MALVSLSSHRKCSEHRRQAHIHDLLMDGVLSCAVDWIKIIIHKIAASVNTRSFFIESMNASPNNTPNSRSDQRKASAESRC